MAVSPARASVTSSHVALVVQTPQLWRLRGDQDTGIADRPGALDGADDSPALFSPGHTPPQVPRPAAQLSAKSQALKGKKNQQTVRSRPAPERSYYLLWLTGQFRC